MSVTKRLKKILQIFVRRTWSLHVHGTLAAVLVGSEG